MRKKSEKVTRIATTIENNLLKKLKDTAEKEGRHMNYYIEKGLRLVLKDHGENNND